MAGARSGPCDPVPLPPSSSSERVGGRSTVPAPTLVLLVLALARLRVCACARQGKAKRRTHRQERTVGAHTHVTEPQQEAGRAMAGTRPGLGGLLALVLLLASAAQASAQQPAKKAASAKFVVSLQGLVRRSGDEGGAFCRTPRRGRAPRDALAAAL